MKRHILLFINVTGIVILFYLAFLKINQIDFVSSKNGALHLTILGEFKASNDIDFLKSEGEHYLTLLREERLEKSRLATRESYLYIYLTVVLGLNLWNERNKN